MFVLSGNDRDALLKDLRSYVFITCASFEPRILTVPDLLRANASRPGKPRSSSFRTTREAGGKPSAPSSKKSTLLNSKRRFRNRKWSNST